MIVVGGEEEIGASGDMMGWVDWYIQTFNLWIDGDGDGEGEGEGDGWI